MPKRGLPETVRMRHDEHYVEALTSSAGSPIGRMVPIDELDPNLLDSVHLAGARFDRMLKRLMSG